MESAVLRELEHLTNAVPKVFEATSEYPQCVQRTLVTSGSGSLDRKCSFVRSSSELFYIGAKLLRIIKAIHANGVVHNGISLETLIFADDHDLAGGLGLLGFDDARMFVNPKTRAHIPEHISRDNSGTQTPWEHLLFPRSRRDDFFRVAYILLYKVGARAPSTHGPRPVAKDEAQVLCAMSYDTYPELNEMMAEACQLGFTEEPNYDKWIAIFETRAEAEPKPINTDPVGRQLPGKSSNPFATGGAGTAAFVGLRRASRPIRDAIPPSELQKITAWLAYSISKYEHWNGVMMDLQRSDLEIRLGLASNEVSSGSPDNTVLERHTRARIEKTEQVVACSSSLSLKCLVGSVESEVNEILAFRPLHPDSPLEECPACLPVSPIPAACATCRPQSRAASPISITEGVDIGIATAIQMSISTETSTSSNLYGDFKSPNCDVSHLRIIGEDYGIQFHTADYAGSSKTVFYLGKGVSRNIEYVVKVVPRIPGLIFGIDTEKGVHKIIRSLPSDHPVRPYVVDSYDFHYDGISDENLRTECMKRTIVTEKAGERNMRDIGKQSKTAIAGMAVYIIEALKALHSLGIIHGDIHRKNIMIYGIGTKNAGIKIIDFGRARVYVEHTGIIEPEFTPTGCFNRAMLSPFELEHFPAITRDDMYRTAEMLYYSYQGERFDLDEFPMRKRFEEGPILAEQKRHMKVDGFDQLVEFHHEMASLEYYDRPDYEKWTDIFEKLAYPQPPI
jgi:serine/threonine protein kinase